uniref:LIM zinc-binding domain-containing protein n=1 Tax=Ditylenchus dipsaci TaxID=166011 RepID=A0A915DIT8_9BILA
MHIPGDNLPECGICDEAIGVMEPKVKIQRQIFHKECFKCVICDQDLEIGCCGMDHGLCRYFGPLWFCNIHMNLGSGEKYELIKERRRQMKAN